VSGGRTPALMFAHLARHALDWPRIHITIADERWVGSDDPASNEGLVRATLLRGAAAQARFQGLKNAAVTPAAGAVQAWEALGALPRPFDVVVLGMGEDGHTASLFPGDPQLAAALDASAPPGCLEMHSPAAPQLRLSLNLAALLDARRIFIQILVRKNGRSTSARARRGKRPSCRSGPFSGTARSRSMCTGVRTPAGAPPREGS